MEGGLERTDWRGMTSWGGGLGGVLGGVLGRGFGGLEGLVWGLETDGVYGFGLGGFRALVWRVAWVRSGW